jgi:hypothetical protein
LVWEFTPRDGNGLLCVGYYDQSRQHVIKAAYEAGIRLTSDERILGRSSFVAKTLASAGEYYAPADETESFRHRS